MIDVIPLVITSGSTEVRLCAPSSTRQLAGFSLADEVSWLQLNLKQPHVRPIATIHVPGNPIYIEQLQYFR